MIRTLQRSGRGTALFGLLRDWPNGLWLFYHKEWDGTFSLKKLKLWKLSSFIKNIYKKKRCTFGKKMEVNSINEFLHVTPIPKRHIALPSKTSRGPSKVIYSFFNTRFLLMFFLDVPTCSLAAFCRVCDWVLLQTPIFFSSLYFFFLVFYF